jgi:hypothetical protein
VLSTFEAGSFFPSTLAVPLDQVIERLGPQRYCFHGNNLLKRPAEGCLFVHID